VLPRVFLALDNVRKKHPGETVALVCHAGIIYAVEAYLKAQVDHLQKQPSIPAQTRRGARIDPRRYDMPSRISWIITWRWEYHLQCPLAECDLLVSLSFAV
jgi:broad specificity phosphatase PhoE